MATYDPGDEPGRCCAKSKQSGARCKKTVVHGRNVCRYHGGLGGRPPKNGRYSRYIKKGFLARAYQAALEDPDSWSIDEHLAVLDAACRESAERLGQSDCPDYRKRVLEMVVSCEKARDSQDYQAFVQHFEALADIARRGAERDEVLGDFLRKTERRAKRLEEAWKIRLNAASTINSKDLVTVLARFVDIVEQNSDVVTSTKIREAIEVELLQNHQISR